MHLFSLPSELVQLIFNYLVLSRAFPRVMRIRLVSRKFPSWPRYTVAKIVR
jgi:hypothetical protein